MEVVGKVEFTGPMADKLRKLHELREKRVRLVFLFCLGVFIRCLAVVCPSVVSCGIWPVSRGCVIACVCPFRAATAVQTRLRCSWFKRFSLVQAAMKMDNRKAVAEENKRFSMTPEQQAKYANASLALSSSCCSNPRCRPLPSVCVEW